MASEEEPTTRVETTEAVLRRYRGSFRRLLQREIQFVKKARNRGLADLAFQTLLQQTEQLSIAVVVDEREEPIVDPADLRRFRLEMLETYLRKGDDITCLFTARFHLADLIRAEHEWDPREWEWIETLAYRYSSNLITPHPGATPTTDILEMDSGLADAWLARHVQRSDWLGVAEYVAEFLTDVDLQLEPFPFVVGIGDVTSDRQSAAWDCIGFGAIAGLDDDQPHGLGVRDQNPEGTYDVHLLAVSPAREGFTKPFADT